MDYIAHKTGYDTSTIYRWIKAGHLPKPNPPHHKARGGRFLWRKQDIDTWIANTFNL